MPFDQTQEDIFRGVDGSSVPEEQWFNIDKSLLPPPLSEEKKEKTRKYIEENKERFEQLQKERDAGMEAGNTRCAPVIRSNYDLSPKTG